MIFLGKSITKDEKILIYFILMRASNSLEKKKKNKLNVILIFKISQLCLLIWLGLGVETYHAYEGKHQA